MCAATSMKGKSPSGDMLTVKVNEATVAIVQSYLDYVGRIITEVLNKQAYSTQFKEINDDLVIKPDELVALIDRIQNALLSAND